MKKSLIDGLEWTKEEIEKQIKFYKKSIEHAERRLKEFEEYLKKCD